MEYNHKSYAVTTFQDFSALEDGIMLVGYAALIAKHNLPVPPPDYLCAIGTKHKKYDLLNEFIKNYIDMPDNLVDLLIRFLGQNNGKLSKRKCEKEFNQSTDAEVQVIEQHKYDDMFVGDTEPNSQSSNNRNNTLPRAQHR